MNNNEDAKQSQKQIDHKKEREQNVEEIETREIAISAEKARTENTEDDGAEKSETETAEQTGPRK